MIPEDPAELSALAGEYVLGTLEARAAAEVTAALPAHPALAEAVAGWEARLAPLLALATPEAPPPELWARIEAALPADPRAAPRMLPPAAAAASRGFGFWRGWAIGASLASLALGGFILLRPAPPPQLMTVLLSQRDQPAWMVSADRGGAIRLAALNPRQMEQDKVLQLWVLPNGATAPTSLGLIPAGGQVTVTPTNIRPEPGMLMEISLEPPGGSTTGRPTGPVLFIGRLAPATGS